MAMLFANAPRMLGRKAVHPAGLALVGLATTIALIYGFVGHSQSSPQADRVWAGQLTAAVPADSQPSPTMSSASLVVPKSELTLPPLPAKPVVRVKNSCDSADRFCAVRPIPVVPPRRQVAVASNGQGLLLPPASIPAAQPVARIAKPAPAPAKPGLLGQLNPLNHIPDMATIGRPFAAAGSTVTGWIKWL